MESVTGSFNQDEQKSTFTLAGEVKVTTTAGNYNVGERRNLATVQEDAAMSSIIPGVGGNDLLNMTHQEPRAADPATSVADIDELLSNIRIIGNDMLSDENNASNYFTGLSSANNYVSMLTYDQLYVLRSIRPSLLYELLLDVAKARSDRRARRPYYTECAFCKNNGENEDCYSNHALKDADGRVLCPVLRAFRCPRCGATGDHAHTIKYCPESVDPIGGGLSVRRRAPPSTSLFRGASSSRTLAPATAPAVTPLGSPVNTFLSYSSLWSNFNIN